MNEKTLVLVALSLSVCASYGREPSAVSWIPVNPMHRAAVPFPDGHVLVPRGHVAHETETNSADLFDPETGTWAPAGLMNATRTGHFALVLRGNRGVLVMGALTKSPASSNSVDIFELCRCPELE
jgi:hypothetical protein